MSLSVDYIYSFARKLIRKAQAGGLSATDFQYYWNGEQLAYMGDLLGRFQKSSDGKDGINTGLIENQTILTKLSPFTKNVTLTITTGTSNKPAGFIYELALRISGKDVIPIKHGQIASVNGSVIDPPSIDNNAYYCVEYEGYYSFLPTSVTSAALDYIEAPTAVVWGYTLDADGREEYASGTSTQPQWDDISNSEITKRMLKTLGVSFKDADFANFGQSIITQGS